MRKSHRSTLRFTVIRSTVFSYLGAKVLKITEIWNGAKEKNEVRKTLKNDALDAKIGVDRAANEHRNRKNRRPCYREAESSQYSVAS